MSEVTTKASLTPARRRLLELMQEINFGRIEGLAVREPREGAFRKSLDTNCH